MTIHLKTERQPARHEATGPESQEAHQRRLEAMHTNYLESNPFDAEDIALFEMFDREGWDHEQRIAYLRKLAAQAGSGPTPDE